MDDVTLSALQFGQPSFGLMANDWMDGRSYKVAAGELGRGLAPV